MTRLDPEDARQGKKGTPVLKVLISGLVLCVIVAAGMAIYAWAMPDSTMPSATSSGSSSSAPAAPASTDATTTPTPAN